MAEKVVASGKGGGFKGLFSEFFFAFYYYLTDLSDHGSGDAAGSAGGLSTADSGLSTADTGAKALAGGWWMKPLVAGLGRAWVMLLARFFEWYKNLKYIRGIRKGDFTVIIHLFLLQKKLVINLNLLGHPKKNYT